MPIRFLSRLTAPERSERTNLHLGMALSLVAGALNAGGFLAVGQYTSHMTGIVSSVADNLALAKGTAILAGLGSLLAFILGAATTAILVNRARRHEWANLYSAPLALEAFLLLTFGVVAAVGSRLAMPTGVLVFLTVALLCYVMGLQNALITKISNAEIRTTHVTGLVTDVGISIGRAIYQRGNRFDLDDETVLGQRQRFRTQVSLIGCFFAGGVMGAFGFKYVGYPMVIPLAAVLATIALAPRFRSVD